LRLYQTTDILWIWRFISFVLHLGAVSCTW